MKKYKWEQEQIANMKEYIARFGHGSAKLARQAQVRRRAPAPLPSLLLEAAACVRAGTGERLRGARRGAVACDASLWRSSALPHNAKRPPRSCPARVPSFSAPPKHPSPAVQGEGAGQDGAGGAHRKGGDRPGEQQGCGRGPPTVVPGRGRRGSLHAGWRQLAWLWPARQPACRVAPALRLGCSMPGCWPGVHGATVPHACHRPSHSALAPTPSHCIPTPPDHPPPHPPPLPAGRQVQV